MLSFLGTDKTGKWLRFEAQQVAETVVALRLGDGTTFLQNFLTSDSVSLYP